MTPASTSVNRIATKKNRRRWAFYLVILGPSAGQCTTGATIFYSVEDGEKNR